MKLYLISCIELKVILLPWRCQPPRVLYPHSEEELPLGAQQPLHVVDYCEHARAIRLETFDASLEIRLREAFFGLFEQLCENLQNMTSARCPVFMALTVRRCALFPLGAQQAFHVVEHSEYSRPIRLEIFDASFQVCLRETLLRLIEQLRENLRSMTRPRAPSLFIAL